MGYGFGFSAQGLLMSFTGKNTMVFPEKSSIDSDPALRI